MNEDFFRKVYGRELLKKIDDKILLLGSSYGHGAIYFLNMRLLSSILMFILVCLIAMMTSFEYGYFFAAIIAIIYYYIYEKVTLDDRIELRIKKLNNEAIYYFEVLTLSLQTGRNLEEAIMITSNAIDSELSKEFKEALREVKYGKSLSESLNDMQKRIPSDSINNIILNLTEANIYGSSIIDEMYNQIDYLREKRKMEVKSAISKIPTKVSVLSVFFFIPLLLLIILGPVLINYIGK